MNDKGSKSYLDDSNLIGQQMHEMVKDLFPICRSITGEGVRETLNYLKARNPQLTIHSISSGKKVFDWTIPDEWTIRSAFIEDESGNRIVDMSTNNLHVIGYSEPVDEFMPLKKLEQNLYSLPDQPDAIPYITSYYKKRWGFCLTHKQRESLKDGIYHVVIDSEKKPGVLNYADLIIPGKSSKEVMLSTYVCHPSMANNELSGPVVTSMLAEWISTLKDNFYSYRFIFIPETIGSIAYLSKNIDHLKKNVVAGFNISCVGDERCFSFLPSRNGNTQSDRVARHVLRNLDANYKRYTWLDRGSDERQYCAPGVDLPISSIMRSKYGEYPEYHTSHDDLSLVTPKGLRGGFNAIRKSIEIIEKNHIYISKILCEPQMGKRELYPTLSGMGISENVEIMMNFLSYCDGTNDLLTISEIMDVRFELLVPVAKSLIDNAIIEEVSNE